MTITLVQCNYCMSVYDEHIDKLVLECKECQTDAYLMVTGVLDNE